MKKHNNNFYAIAALITSLFLCAPAFAQTVNNLMLAQPVPQPSEVPAAEAPQAPAAVAPESAQPQHPAQTVEHRKQHKAKTIKHASVTHKKKSPHKTAAASTHNKHVKKASRKADSKSKHANKKPVPPQQPHASNAHKHLKHRLARANIEKHGKKHPSDVSSATFPAVKHTAPVTMVATSAPKSVTYSFCMGYDNCVPTRYETTSVGGKTGAKVLQKDQNGNWNEAKCDPTVMADLGKMAQAENGGRVERDLTPQEKALIADHQGKMHATLVSAVNSGNKEEIKTTMRQLNIQSMNDLNAYDARLCTRETATQAVNEISVGR